MAHNPQKTKFVKISVAAIHKEILLSKDVEEVATIEHLSMQMSLVRTWKTTNYGRDYNTALFQNSTICWPLTSKNMHLFLNLE